MEKVKYALLDTDFISKMYVIQKDDANHLIDRIIELPEYKFYCHSKIKEELKMHNVSGAMEWLEDRIKAGKIYCYNDCDIIKDLELIYSNSAPAMYITFLKRACEVFKLGYFEENFYKLHQISYKDLSSDKLLDCLYTACDNINIGKNLGELKTYILLQLLSVMHGKQIYVFCSDDYNARNGIISLGDVRCISVLSSFLRLKRESDFQFNDAKGYIESWLRFCDNIKQTTFKVRDNTKENRVCRIPCEQVMKEIYEDKYDELLTGDLKYK